MVKVFKDILAENECELCSDSYESEKKFEDAAIFVKSTYIEVTDDCGIPDNDEEGGAGGAEGPTRVLNIQHHFNLIETAYTKAEYMTWVKGYMKRLLEKVTTSYPDRAASFKAGAQTLVKFVLENHENCTFYANSDMDDKGMIIPALWTNEEKENEGPTFIYFADGIRIEKY